MEVAPETLGVVPYVRVPLLVIAALLGAFGLVPRPGGADDVYSSATLEARVRSTEHLREHERCPLDIQIRNTSDEPRDLVVTLSPEYLEAFEEVAMIPEPREGWTVRLEDVAPGEDRLVALELEAGAPGPYRGEVQIRADHGEVLVIPLRTHVSP